MEATADERDRTADIERYEQLRGRALDGEPSGWRLGLALLQRRGVAAWTRGWQTTTTTPPPTKPVVGTVVAGDEVVGVLAAMALACLEAR